MKQYVHYGCGLTAPSEWINYDISPTLRIQKIPLIGKFILKRFHPVFFPDNVKYGDITKGLPGIKANSCDGVYCSHTLEHLSLQDCRIALKKTYEMLKPGGIFRCVVPDLEKSAQIYLERLSQGNSEASIQFMQSTLLGVKARKKGMRAMLSGAVGNSEHLWMWDTTSLSVELEKAGFSSVRPCVYNDSADPMFQHVEHEGRFYHAVALEALK